MALLPALLLLLLPLAALAAAALLLGLPGYDIPPGVNQPAKLRLVLTVLLGTAALVSAGGPAGWGDVRTRGAGLEWRVPAVPVGCWRCRIAARGCGEQPRICHWVPAVRTLQGHPRSGHCP